MAQVTDAGLVESHSGAMSRSKPPLVPKVVPCDTECIGEVETHSADILNCSCKHLTAVESGLTSLICHRMGPYPL